MRRKKKDIDIYRILMLPLMTMFLLNIGLIATTWAWYTASISTGVNSIKAGVDVSVSVSPEASVNNGIYSLQSGNEYTFTFTLGNAANGYYALITVSNPTVATNPLTNLFMTSAYAESEELYAVEIPAENTTKEITIHAAEDKQIRFDYLWKSDEIADLGDGKIEYKEVEYSLISNSESPFTIGKLEVVYTVTFVDGENNEVSKTEYKTKENSVTVIAPEGYYLHPEGEETSPVSERSYQVEYFPNQELKIEVVSKEPEPTILTEGEQSSEMANESSVGTNPPAEIPISEGSLSKQESEESISDPSQSTENPTSETETTSTPAAGETIEEQSNTEVNEAGEVTGVEETTTEEKTEIEDAQSETGE